MMRAVLTLALTLLAALATRPAAAHPHVWIDATLGLEMTDGKVTALDIVWLFDEFYSELVRGDFDQDGDGKLSQRELDALVGVSAASLSEHSFFTHLRIGDDRPLVAAVRDFYIEDDGERVSYRFRVPLRQAVDVNETPFAVGLFDDTYYVDIAVADSKVEVPDPACRLVPKEALDEPLYYGMIYPTYYHLACGGA